MQLYESSYTDNSNPKFKCFCNSPTIGPRISGTCISLLQDSQCLNHRKKYLKLDIPRVLISTIASKNAYRSAQKFSRA